MVMSVLCWNDLVFDCPYAFTLIFYLDLWGTDLLQYLSFCYYYFYYYCDDADDDDEDDDNNDDFNYHY